jgi:hypothetical protein
MGHRMGLQHTTTKLHKIPQENAEVIDFICVPRGGRVASQWRAANPGRFLAPSIFLLI